VTTAITATATTGITAAATKAGSASLPPVARLRFKGAGPIGVALTAWDIWRRIPKQHRKTIVRQARKHGPRVATAVIAARQRRKTRPRP
jgi:hypothetical protein